MDRCTILSKQHYWLLWIPCLFCAVILHTKSFSVMKEYRSCNMKKKPNFCFIGKQSMLPCPGSGFKPCVVDQGPFSPLLHRIEMDKLSELQVVREAGQGLKENLKQSSNSKRDLGLVPACKHVCRGAPLKDHCLNICKV